MEETKSKHYRIKVNVNRTTANKKGWDCTVEGEGCTRKEVLAESGKLVADLDKLYPIEVESK